MNIFKKYVWSPFIVNLVCFLRYIEVLLCIRKKTYKTHTFKKNPRSEHYHNKEKWIKRY